LKQIDTPGTPSTSYTKGDEEWLELYNRGGNTIDLSSWEINGGISYNFPVGTMLASGEYLVVAKDASALAQKHPGITIVGDFSGSLGNGGDHLVLEDAHGNPADEVTYFDGGKWPGKADGGGSSLELLDPDADNNTATAWAASDETERSSWNTFTYEEVAVSDGIGNNAYHEFLIGLLDSGEFLLDDVSVIENGSTEMIQNGDFEGDSLGSTADKWRALGTHGSHGKTVVVDDPDSPGNQCLHIVATGPTGDKHNKLETTFSNNEQVTAGATYRISFRAKFLSGNNQVNTRLYFNYLQRTTTMPASEIWGTPGEINSTALGNIGPTMEALAHAPVVPDANQAVNVAIDASDAGRHQQPHPLLLNQWRSLPKLAHGRRTERASAMLAPSLARQPVASSDSTSELWTPPMPPLFTRQTDQKAGPSTKSRTASPTTRAPGITFVSSCPRATDSSSSTPPIA
jgi:hypothetical protein